MALVIYDSGVRIQTPVSSLLAPRGVEATTEPSRSRELPSSEDRTQSPATPLKQQTPSKQSYSGKAKQAYQTTQRLNRRDQDVQQRPTLVSQIMTAPVFTLAVGASVEEAFEQFHIHQVHHLAVVDEHEQCHGVVSEYTLLRRGSLFNQQGPTRADLTIEGAYPTLLISATPDTPIHQIAVTLLKRRLSNMPVIDDQGQLVGIVTLTDLVHMVANEASRERWA
ncbi:MAG: CBS domain-containing membrane protein [Motiliproteus sp.]|jgi:CBS domain-containing membrane protein